MLAAESGARQRIRYTGFPAIKTITDFDFTAHPAVDRAQIARLEAGGWLAEARNIVLLGPPGTWQNPPGDRVGDRRGPRRAPGRLRPGHRLDHSTGRSAPHRPELRKIARYGLIVIDEVGYIPFDTEAANLSFQLVSTRYEKSSVILTSNCRFPAGARSSARPPSPQR